MAAENNSIEIAQTLAVFLKKELELYHEVYDLSVKQIEVIRVKDSEKLLRIIDEKQMRIAKISGIEREAAPYKARREKELESWDAGVRAIVDPYIIELRKLLGDIVKVEEDCHKAAEVVTKSSSNEVVRMQKGKAMLNAYGRSVKVPNAQARFKDKKG